VSDHRAFDNYSNKTLALFRQKADADEACDVQDLFSRFTLDTSGEFLFNTKEINSLDLPLPPPRNLSTTESPQQDTQTKALYEKFAEGLEEAQKNSMKRRASGFKWFFTEFFKDSQVEPVAAIRAWLDPLVAAALDRESKRKEVGGPLPIDDAENGTFIDHLAATSNDPKLLRDQLLNIVMAARDTTACLLTFTSYLLALHPDIMDKLRNEVLEACGETEVPSYETMRSLRYCECTDDCDLLWLITSE